MNKKILSLRIESPTTGGGAAKVAELRNSIHVGVNQFYIPGSYVRSVTRDELKAVVGQVEQLIQLDIKKIEWGLENVYKMVTLPPFDDATVQDRVSIFRELTMFCENICEEKGYLLGKALAKHYFGYNFRNISLISDAGSFFSEAAYIYLELDRVRDAQRCFFVAGETYEGISNSEMKTSRAYMRAHGLSLELNERFLIIDAYAASKIAITSFVNQQEKYSMANILNFCIEMIEIGNKFLDLKRLCNFFSVKLESIVFMLPERTSFLTTSPRRFQRV